MAQSLTQIILHIVFSTKGREPIITDEIERELHPYLATVCRSKGSECFRVGGTANHIHIACTLPRTISISDFISEIKSNSSKWLNSKAFFKFKFTWQGGYGAFSIGYSNLPKLVSYIDNQKEHHKTKTFKEELIEFFEKYSVEFNSQYIWD